MSGDAPRPDVPSRRDDTPARPGRRRRSTRWSRVAAVMAVAVCAVLVAAVAAWATVSIRSRPSSAPSPGTPTASLLAPAPSSPGAASPAPSSPTTGSVGVGASLPATASWSATDVDIAVASDVQVFAMALNQYRARTGRFPAQTDYADFVVSEGVAPSPRTFLAAALTRDGTSFCAEGSNPATPRVYVFDALSPDAQPYGQPGCNGTTFPVPGITVGEAPPPPTATPTPSESASGSASPSPARTTPKPTPKPTPTPTAEPTPTRTPKPNRTPKPTPSPTPTADRPRGAYDDPSRLHGTAASRQVIVVEAPDAGSTRGTLHTYQRGNDGRWRTVLGDVPAWLGWAGVTPGATRQQGSGTTPTGTYPLTWAFGANPNPGTRLPYAPTTPQSRWPYDPNDPRTYNVFQPYPPASASWAPDDVEDLWAMREQYAYALVVDFNTPAPGTVTQRRNGLRVTSDPVDTRRGGGIFLHVDTKPTAGCVGITERQLRGILRWLDPAAAPVIVIGTTAQFRAR